LTFLQSYPFPLLRETLRTTGGGRPSPANPSLKSGNISETRNGVKIEESYYGKPTQLQDFTNALSNGTILDPLRPPPLRQDWGLATPSLPPKTSIAITSGMGKVTDFKFGRYCEVLTRGP